jgi:hypothetical protein
MCNWGITGLARLHRSQTPPGGWGWNRCHRIDQSTSHFTVRECLCARYSWYSTTTGWIFVFPLPTGQVQLTTGGMSLWMTCLQGSWSPSKKAEIYASNQWTSMCCGKFSWHTLQSISGRYYHWYLSSTLSIGCSFSDISGSISLTSINSCLNDVSWSISYQP